MSAFEPRGEHALHLHFVSSRVRRFTVTSNDYETLTFSGVDATPEEVMRHRQKALTTAWEAKHCPTGNELYRFAENWGNEVLWEGNAVVAVLVPRGTPDMKVTIDAYRFDNFVYGKKPGRLWPWHVDEAESYGDGDDGDDSDD